MARIIAKEVARTSAAEICRGPSRPEICSTYEAGYRLMERDAPLQELDQFLTKLSDQFGLPADGQDLAEYLNGRKDLPELATTLYRQFFIYAASREEAERIRQRQRRLNDLKASLAEFEELFRPMAITIAVLVAGVSAGRATLAYRASVRREKA